MKKIILITGATDGIGLATAKMLAEENHELLIHGKSREKLEKVKKELLEINDKIKVDMYCADFANLEEVYKMAEEVISKNEKLDVLINNAGIFVVEDDEVITKDGIDIRFSVNTVAPYILTSELLQILNEKSRVINLASAAQSEIEVEWLENKKTYSHSEAYAQSKLALIMWSIEMAKQNPNGPSVITINPKSFLGSKMVEKAYGKKGYDLNIGAKILCRAALSYEFKDASGKYFDNDEEDFKLPHAYALDESNRKELMENLKKY